MKNNANQIVLAIIVVFVLIMITTAYYITQTLKQITITDFKLDGLNEFDENSFTLSGKLYVDNPSIISIPLKNSSYEIKLKSTNQTLGSGFLPETTLTKKSITEIPFSQNIEWVPTVSLVEQLITQDKVELVISGTILVDTPIYDYPLTFEQTTDIKPYVDQFIQKQLEQLNQQLPGLAEQLPELIEQGKQFVEGLFN